MARHRTHARRVSERQLEFSRAIELLPGSRFGFGELGEDGVEDEFWYHTVDDDMGKRLRDRKRVPLGICRSHELIPIEDDRRNVGFGHKASHRPPRENTREPTTASLYAATVERPARNSGAVEPLIEGGTNVTPGGSAQSASTMRAQASPSHNGMGAERRFPPSAARAVARIVARLKPTRAFVPCVMVTGRSVFSRTVRHGTPSTEVSSWTPPESVRTMAADASRPRNSR